MYSFLARSGGRCEYLGMRGEQSYLRRAKDLNMLQLLSAVESLAFGIFFSRLWQCFLFFDHVMTLLSPVIHSHISVSIIVIILLIISITDYCVYYWSKPFFNHQLVNIVSKWQLSFCYSRYKCLALLLYLTICVSRKLLTVK